MRIRIGIGKRGDVNTFVLEPFSKREARAMRDIIEKGVLERVNFLILNGFEKTSNIYNTKEKIEEYACSSFRFFHIIQRMFLNREKN